MSRNFSPLATSILIHLQENKQLPFGDLYKKIEKKIPYKEFYNALYRLENNGFIDKREMAGKLTASITKEGRALLMQLAPKKDGVWKIVIFDVPEKHKRIRVILRAKLKALRFKKWQNSIWISPYELDAEIEQELNELGKKFFIRLIKTEKINITQDLEKMFE